MSAATTAAAIVGAGALGAYATSNAASKAASAQEAAANQANQTEQGFFNTSLQEQQPFISAGQGVLPEIANLEGANGQSNIQATLEGLPGYQFANQQGLKSVQNSATARGLGVSGAAQKGAANYSTGLANQYYNNLLTGLQNTANMGEDGASAIGGVAQNIGTSIGQNTVGAGQAAAAGDIAQGTALTNLGNSVPNALIASSLLQGNANGGNGVGGASNLNTIYGTNEFANAPGNFNFNLGQIGGNTAAQNAFSNTDAFTSANPFG